MLDFLKSSIRLSSPLPFVALIAVPTIWLMLRPGSLRARRLLVAVVVLCWLVTTRALPAVLSAGLAVHAPPITSRADVPNTDVVVVLSGGGLWYREAGLVVGMPSRGTLLRGLEAARVFRAIGARQVIASGGAVNPRFDLRPESDFLRDVLVAAGVPLNRVVQEGGSRTTDEQARAVKTLLGRDGTRRFVLVTSPTHMRRSIGVFRSYGLDPLPSPAPVDSDQMLPPSWLVPNREALYRSDTAIYEYAALMYYWSRGLLRAGV